MNKLLKHLKINVQDDNIHYEFQFSIRLSDNEDDLIQQFIFVDIDNGIYPKGFSKHINYFRHIAKYMSVDAAVVDIFYRVSIF